MITITISNRKGGVCKSTSCLNIAHVLASSGKKVLIIDMDDQQNTSRSISKLVQTDKNIEDLLLKNINLTEVAVKTDWQNVWILPASSNLSGVVKHLDGEVGGHLILKEKLTGSDFDFILIDTSPSLNILVINSLCASDYIFIPLSTKYYSLQGLSQTLDSYNKIVGRLNPNLKILGIGIMYHDKRNVLACEVLEKVRQKYKELVFNTIIGVNIKIEEAQVKKQSIIYYAPIDRGAMSYIELGEEILSRLTGDNS